MLLWGEFGQSSLPGSHQSLGSLEVVMALLLPVIAW